MKGYNNLFFQLLENKTSNEKFLFYIFDFFFRVESPPSRLYHQLPTTLYIGLSGKFLSFKETSFSTTHLYTNIKPNLSKIVIFSLIKQNGS